MICETCGTQHDGSYGSGRFCSAKCARSFSTREKRAEINKRVSETLRSQSRPLIEKVCPTCGRKFEVPYSKRGQKFCSKSCAAQDSNSRPEVLEKISKARISAIQKGKTNHRTIRCTFLFRGHEIRCDSKLEYACLDWFESNHDVLGIRRCEEPILYWFEGMERRYLPDCIVETPETTFLVEVKDTSRMGSLNKKWWRYNEMQPPKKKALAEFAVVHGMTPLWFTSKTPGNRYRTIRVPESQLRP